MTYPSKDVTKCCNVVETCPTVCPSVHTWYEACEYATFYASTVSLLPTHRPETNRVVLRNRRIGVGIIDWSGWVHAEGLHRVTAYMREGYDVVTAVNQRENAAAGVPESIRKTTIKPGGTGPKLPGRTPGIGNPTFDYTLRRMRVAANNPICPVLDAAGVPWEADFFDPKGTRIYEYPTLQGPAQPADQVSLWEQAMNLVTVQREWSDNAVSNTLYFKPKWELIVSETTFIRDWKGDLDKQRFDQVKSESWLGALHGAQHCADVDGIFLDWIEGGAKGQESGNDEEFKWLFRRNKYGELEMRVWKYDPNHEEDVIEKVLSAIVPLIKSCSLLPHTPKGAYRQMPEEGITKEEYEKRLAAISKIDWSTFRGSDGVDEKFCTGPVCELPSASGR